MPARDSVSLHSTEPQRHTLCVKRLNMESKHLDYACHGSQWPEHEDFLVGNKEGLVKLRNSISKAIEEGESNIDSGEFIGVRCLATEFFENQSNHGSKWATIYSLFIVVVVIAIFIIGLVTVFSWTGCL